MTGGPEEPAADRPDPIEHAIRCARIADEKKADDIVVLEVADLIVITDHFVICTGRNPRQIRTIAEAVQEEMEERDVERLGLEGWDAGSWVLLDYGDFVVQIFDPETRAYYDLELLWGDAPRVEWREDDAGEEPDEDGG